MLAIRLTIFFVLTSIGMQAMDQEFDTTSSSGDSSTALSSDSTPTPDGTTSPTQTQQTSSDAETQATPTTPDIQPEQMSGPDILELSEEKPDELVPSGSPQVATIFEQSKVITEQSDASNNQLWKLAQQFRDQFHQLQTQLDIFYKTSGEQQGRITKDLEEITQPERGTPISLGNQPIMPNLASPRAPTR